MRCARAASARRAGPTTRVQAQAARRRPAACPHAHGRLIPCQARAGRKAAEMSGSDGGEADGTRAAGWSSADEVCGRCEWRTTRCARGARFAGRERPVIRKDDLRARSAVRRASRGSAPRHCPSSRKPALLRRRRRRWARRLHAATPTRTEAWFACLRSDDGCATTSFRATRWTSRAGAHDEAAENDAAVVQRGKKERRRGGAANQTARCRAKRSASLWTTRARAAGDRGPPAAADGRSLSTTRPTRRRAGGQGHRGEPCAGGVAGARVARRDAGGRAAGLGRACDCGCATGRAAAASGALPRARAQAEGTAGPAPRLRRGARPPRSRRAERRTRAATRRARAAPEATARRSRRARVAFEAQAGRPAAAGGEAPPPAAAEASGEAEARGVGSGGGGGVWSGGGGGGRRRERKRGRVWRERRRGRCGGARSDYDAVVLEPHPRHVRRGARRVYVVNSDNDNACAWVAPSAVRLMPEAEVGALPGWLRVGKAVEAVDPLAAAWRSRGEARDAGRRACKGWRRAATVPKLRAARPRRAAAASGHASSTCASPAPPRPRRRWREEEEPPAAALAASAHQPRRAKRSAKLADAGGRAHVRRLARRSWDPRAAGASGRSFAAAPPAARRVAEVQVCATPRPPTLTLLAPGVVVARVPAEAAAGPAAVRAAVRAADGAAHAVGGRAGVQGGAWEITRFQVQGCVGRRHP